MKTVILLLLLCGVLCLASEEVAQASEQEDVKPVIEDECPVSDDDLLDMEDDEDTRRQVVMCLKYWQKAATRCTNCKTSCGKVWCKKKCRCNLGRKKRRTMVVQRWRQSGCPGIRCSWRKTGSCKRMYCQINGRMKWFGGAICKYKPKKCRWKKVSKWCRKKICFVGKRKKPIGKVQCTTASALKEARGRVMSQLKNICQGNVKVDRRGRVTAPKCSLKIPGIPGLIRLPKMPRISMPNIRLPRCANIGTTIPAKTIGRNPLSVTFGPAKINANICRTGLQTAKLTGPLRARLLGRFSVVFRGTLIRHKSGKMKFVGSLVSPKKLLPNLPIPHLKLDALKDVVLDFKNGLPRDFTLKGNAKVLGLRAQLKGHIVDMKKFVGVAELTRASLDKIVPKIVRKLVVLDRVKVAVANENTRVGGKLYTKGISASMRVCPGSLLRRALPSKLRNKCINAKDINLSLPTISVGEHLKKFKLKFGSLLKIWDVKMFFEWPNALKKGIWDADVEEDVDQINFGAGIKANIRLKLPFNKALVFKVGTKYKPSTSELICYGHMISGTWKHAFNIPFLEVKGAYVELGFGPGGVLGISRIGVGGHLSFGPVKVSVFTRLSTDFSDAMLYGKTNKVTLRDVGEFLKLKGLPRVQFPKLEIFAAPKAGVIAGMAYKRGFRLNAQLKLFGIRAFFDMKLQMRRGIPDFMTSVKLQGLSLSIGRKIQQTLGRVLPSFIRKILGKAISVGVSKLEIANFSLRALAEGRSGAKLALKFYAGVGRIKKHISFSLKMPNLAALFKTKIFSAVKNFIKRNWKKWFWVKKGWKLLLKMIGKLADLGKVAAKKVLAAAKKFGKAGKKMIKKYSRKVGKFVRKLKIRALRLKKFKLKRLRLKRLRLKKLRLKRLKLKKLRLKRLRLKKLRLRRRARAAARRARAAARRVKKRVRRVARRVGRRVRRVFR